MPADPPPPPKTDPAWADAMDADHRAIGDRIRNARHDAGMSQMRLAGLMDVSANTVLNIELGRNSASVATLKLIALHLNTDPRNLLGGHPAPFDSGPDNAKQTSRSDDVNEPRSGRSP